MAPRAVSRFLAAAIAVAALAGGSDVARSIAAGQDQPPRPTFRTEANYVRVDVFPTKGGAPVSDLTQADFEILEGGAPQKIEQFEHIAIQGAGSQDTRIEPIPAAIDGVLETRPASEVASRSWNYVTLGFGQIIAVVFRNIESLGGALGLNGIPAHTNLFWVFAAATITVYVVTTMVNSSAINLIAHPIFGNITIGAYRSV